MQFKLYGKNQEPDDAEPEFTLNGKIAGAESGEVVIKVNGRYFLYADTDGETYVEFREARTVFDASSILNEGSERLDRSIG